MKHNSLISKAVLQVSQFHENPFVKEKILGEAESPNWICFMKHKTEKAGLFNFMSDHPF